MGTNSNCCDEELILEGLEIDTSRINSIVEQDTMQNVPLMPMKMEITSIEDFKVHEDSQNKSKGQTKLVEEYYDASNHFSFEEEVRTLKAKVTQREWRSYAQT